MRNDSSRPRRSARPAVIFVIILLIIAFGAGHFLPRYLSGRFGWNHEQEPPEPEIDIAYLEARMEDVADLTTVELIYSGLITYTNGGRIPILTRNGFSMTYQATVRAGIDLTQMEIELTDTRVIITLPQTEIQSVHVDPDSIVFYDESHSIFNRTENEDTVNAISTAEQDVQDNVDLQELLNRSREQAEAIIRGVLEGQIGDRQLVIR
ncbi:MAG: DUF4230 domain-containing protein [Lachnospiraceae bacterium]|nr:DUF4230 domain-containing protein [Lachnospiraceae bacterium]